MKYTVYSLHDPETGKVRYIGMTRTSLPKRLSNHMSFAKWRGRGGCRLHRWLLDVAAKSTVPAIRPISIHDSPKDARAAEIALILNGTDLLNEQHKDVSRQVSAVAVGLATLRWKNKTPAERMAHSKKMTKARRKQARMARQKKDLAQG